MMSWKSFVLNFIWFVISIFWIDMLSVQDKGDAANLLI